MKFLAIMCQNFIVKGISTTYFLLLNFFGDEKNVGRNMCFLATNLSLLKIGIKNYFYALILAMKLSSFTKNFVAID